jgi:hypothetical protein
MAENPHVGDTDVVVRATFRQADGTTVVDLSAASAVEMRYRPPRGAWSDWEAVTLVNPPGTDGLAEITIAELTEALTWRLHGRTTGIPTAGALRHSRASFVVDP